MPKKKDSLIIGAVLLIAVVLFIVSRVMPKTDLNQKTADVTLAPDAVEYLDATPEASAEPTDSPEATPEPTAVPEETALAEATAMPTAEASAPIEVTAEPTEAPQSANMMGHACAADGRSQRSCHHYGRRTSIWRPHPDGQR